MEEIIEGLEQIEAENTAIEEIDTENVNLMFIATDQSGSMSSYSQDMLDSLKNFKDAIGNSKEVDEILIARASFDDNINVGGYKRVTEFDTAFRACGCTAMYDCIVDGVEKLLKYREFLRNEGVRVKTTFGVFSDGLDNVSKHSFKDAKESIARLNQEEITTAFISFGGKADKEASDLGFKNILKAGSSASELRKSFNTLSKSVIESSKSVVPDGDNFFVDVD